MLQGSRSSKYAHLDLSYRADMANHWGPKDQCIQEIYSNVSIYAFPARVCPRQSLMFLDSRASSAFVSHM